MEVKRRMRTPEEMFPEVEQWQKSGIGKEQYAREHGIGYGTFQYWCSRYRNQSVESALAIREEVRGTVPAFVPLQMIEERAVSAASVVIVLPSGIRIEVM